MKTETDLQIAIKLLTDHVQQMVNKGVLGKHQIEKYERILDLLKSHTEQSEKYTGHIENKNWQLYNEMLALNDKILRLEAICLLHGISDINVFLARPTELLISQVIEGNKEGWRRLPDDFKNKYGLSNFLIPEVKISE